MFADILRILDAKMTTPTLYGWFHCLWLLIVVGVTVLLCRWFKEGTQKQVRTIVLTTAILVILLEIYKQINFTFQVSQDGKVIGDYQWYAFPFQFCSTPMYAGLLAGLARKGRLHESMCAFLATFAIFAGLAVMVYPGDVFTATVGINIQTMVCHGSMIVVGVYLLYTGYVKVTHKTILKAIPVFAAAVVIAFGMNEIAFFTGLLEENTFNMFYISRHFGGHLPIYGAVQDMITFYPLELVIYILGFSLAAYIILLCAIGVKAIASKRTKVMA